MAKAELNSNIEAMSGKLGDRVYTTRASGTYVRPYAAPSNPRTPSQQHTRSNLATAAAVWNTATYETELAWDRWAKAHPKRNPLNGYQYTSAPYNAFLSLAIPYLQLNSGGTPPLQPPARKFIGDPVTLAAAAGTGAIDWTASAANRAGVVTVLLAQPLRKVTGRPADDKWRVVDRVTFTDGHLTAATPLPPGLYAAAYQFGCLATGETTRRVELPRLWVPN